MEQERITTNGSQAMENIAEHYASELNSQFRTLNHFVCHAGEIGRAHETFLRGIMERFLPCDIKLSSGFVASPKWTSRQQDILIHKRDVTTLFEVGDCTVIDHQAFLGTIEVKTHLSSSSEFCNAVKKQAEFQKLMQCFGLHAIYAWDAISYEAALDVLWDFVREAPTKNFDLIPDVVCVREKYFLMANRDGDRQSPPYHVLHIGEGGITEGQALLGLVASVWRFGLNTIPPWWLLSWHEHLGMVASKSEQVPWPNDLRKSVMADLSS